MVITLNNDSNKGNLDSTRTFNTVPEHPAPKKSAPTPQVRRSNSAPENTRHAVPSSSNPAAKGTQTGVPAQQKTSAAQPQHKTAVRNLPGDTKQGKGTAQKEQAGEMTINLPSYRKSESPARKTMPADSGMMKTKSTDMGTADREHMNDGYYETRSEGTNTLISVVKAVVYIIFVCVISVFLAIAVINIGNDVFAFVKSDELVEVTVPEMATLDDIAVILSKNDIIKYPKMFKLYAVFKHDDRKYIAGTYSISPMMNYETLLAEFKEKPVTGTVDITIPEGYTTDEIIDLFVTAGIGTREGFADVIENGEFDYWFIDELAESGANEDRIYRLDGYLFPDTYEFYKNSSEKTVINKLLRRFSQIFTKEYREECGAMGYTVDEIITLASLIEKEAAAPSEFFVVSSVFHNRLNNPDYYPKMESDATIVYAIQHETGERTVDTSYDSPYNTYIYRGLPPGPIANPSASAMLAALSPQKTNYFYFVSYNGVTYFSETKAKHDAYVEQFKREKEQMAAAANAEN